jgi:hypothetical protein
VANLWRKFKSLIDGPAMEVVTVQSVSLNGTSKCITYTGGVVIVSGTSVAAGDKAFIRDGRIVGEAPDLTYYEIEV